MFIQAVRQSTLYPLLILEKCSGLLVRDQRDETMLADWCIILLRVNIPIYKFDIFSSRKRKSLLIGLKLRFVIGDSSLGGRLPRLFQIARAHCTRYQLVNTL